MTPPDSDAPEESDRKRAEKDERPSEAEENAREFQEPDKRKLLIATGIAVLIALIVLMVAILPAEYGIDPTGIGGFLGLTKISQASTGPNGGVNNATFNQTLFEFSAEWPLSDQEIDAPTGVSQEGEAQNVTFNVTQANVTRVWANLSWVDDDEVAGEPTRPDVFEVRLIAPDGRQGTTTLGRNAEPGGFGYVNASFEWRPAPRPLTIKSPGPADAYFQFQDMVPPDFTATGEWTAEIRLIEAGDGELQGLPLGGPAADTEEDWTLTISVQSFELDAGDLAAAASRTDAVTLTIAPGRGIEYKLFVNEGGRFNYTWFTGGPDLYFDFHGERAGDTSGDFTSHKEGTAARDQGALKAPFTGTHGWYWENRGSEEVTVRLETAGVYSVVGIR